VPYYNYNRVIEECIVVHGLEAVGADDQALIEVVGRIL
jgi:hypothetical protein